jgi:hypothetical protein
MPNPTVLVDPLVKAQADAAWAAVEVARRQADIAWIAVLTSTVIGVLSVIVSLGIAVLAISGPIRERRTRELEARVSRLRLYERTAFSCSNGLRVLRTLKKRLDPAKAAKPFNAVEVAHFRRRLNLHALSIKHYLDLGLRDQQIVDAALEVQVLLLDVHHLLEGEGDLVRAEDGKIVGPPHLLLTQTTLNARASRRSALRQRLIGYSRLQKARYTDLQEELEDIWSWFWMPALRRKRARDG